MDLPIFFLKKTTSYSTTKLKTFNSVNYIKYNTQAIEMYEH